LLNYKRDGTPFMNLIMCVPLRDQSNKVRYYLGAQLDITGLFDGCVGLGSFRKLLDEQGKVSKKSRDAFEQLSEVFTPHEMQQLATMREQQDDESIVINKPSERNEVDDRPETSPTTFDSGFQLNGEGSAPPLGFYQNVSQHSKLISSNFSLNTDLVPACPASPFTAHTFCLSRFANSGHTPVTPVVPC